MRNLITAIALTISLTSCATLFTSSSQTVNIDSVDRNNQKIDGVACSGRDGEGLSYSLVTPGNINVQRGSGSLILNCKKAGLKPVTQSIPQKVNPVTFVNILFWPGFIVDIMSGSFYKYPANASVVVN